MNLPANQSVDPHPAGYKIFTSAYQCVNALNTQRVTSLVNPVTPRYPAFLPTTSSQALNHMRLWSLHPRYLDPQGLVALWRESLLAQAVLREETKGYRNHPQLERFKFSSAPLAAMSIYLEAIHAESVCRGYSFDRKKFRATRKLLTLLVTSGQMEYEQLHLMQKLRVRNPEIFRKWQREKTWEPHPIFTVRKGDVEDWERP